MTSARPVDSDVRSGILAAAGAYLLWGILPLYFKMVGDVQPLVILAHRIVWSVPTAAVLIGIAGKGRELIAAIANPKIVFALLASSLFIAANWTIYIWAVTSGHVLQGSLGYYINPLISFALAALFFGERFNRLQVFAFALAGAGVINQAVVVGQFPGSPSRWRPALRSMARSANALLWTAAWASPWRCSGSRPWLSLISSSSCLRA